MNLHVAVVFLISTVILLCYIYSFSLTAKLGGKFDIERRGTKFTLRRNQSTNTYNNVTYNETTAKTQASADKKEFVSLLTNSRRITGGHKVEKAKDIFDFCPFEPLDPWRKEVAKYIDDKQGFKSCTMRNNLRPRTKLLNGKILVNDASGLVCKGRCLWYVDEHSNRLGEWENISSNFLCDFIETACSKDVFNEAQSARFVHKQIVEQRNESEERLNIWDHPDLHIIILDSVGSSQFIRALPRTANFLINGMEAIAFRKFNRVGKNSKPNGFSAFFGLTIEEGERMFANLPRIKADLSKKEYCDTYLDNYELIPLEYKRKGYKTLMIDDYSQGFLTYSHCLGMKTEPHHHTYRVFANEIYNDKELKKNLWEGLCKDSLANGLEYLSLFLNSYQDVPKFSLSWMNEIAHDYAGNLYSNDYDLYNFLKNHSNTFKNSFFFLYGDHGCKFGEEAEVAGNLETSNPFLYIVIPKRYRHSPVYEQLLKNSKELVTAHDLHSTFKDILYFQPQYNFSDNSFKNFTSNPRGSSLLRQFQMNVSRNCKTLPIPYKYCICQYGRKTVRDTLEDHGNVTLNQMFGKPAVEGLNKILSSHSPKCHPLVLNNITKVELLVLPNEESVQFEGNAYEVTFAVSGPVQAIFKALFRVEGNDVVLGLIFKRIDVDEVVTADAEWNCMSGPEKDHD